MSDSQPQSQENSRIERRLSIKQVEESINEINVETDLKKTKSVSKLEKRENNTDFPKENLTGLISRLASLSKLDCRKEGCSTGNTSNTTTGNPEPQKNIINSKKHRETVLIDQKLNIQEILNDKNSLLLTEENILERSDMSRDEHLLKMSDKKEGLNNFSNLNNMNNLSFSLDEPMDVQLTDQNYNHLDQLKLSSQFDTFKKKLRNEETPITSEQSKYSPYKKNFKTETYSAKKINLKSPFNTKRELSVKSKNNLNTKSTTLNSLKNSINSKSKSPVGFKVSNPFISNKPKFGAVNINKNKNISVNKNLNPPDKKNFKPAQSKLNKSFNNSIIKNKDSSRNIKSLNSSKIETFNTSFSKKIKKNESVANQLSSEFNVIEEYDYHKILTELRAIFGEDLEFFDENMLFSNLDEIANKGLVKGLIKLCHIQDKTIKNFDSSLLKMKSQIKNEILQKDKTIRSLNEELSNLRGSLKGLLGDAVENESNISLNSGRSSFTKGQSSLNKSYQTRKSFNNGFK